MGGGVQAAPAPQRIHQWQHHQRGRRCQLQAPQPRGRQSQAGSAQQQRSDQRQPGQRPQQQQAEQGGGNRQGVEGGIQPPGGGAPVDIRQLCIQRVRHDVHARHQSGGRVDGRGKDVAQAHGHGADQHVFAVKGVRRHLTAQHVDIGVRGPLRCGAGVGNALALLLYPGLGWRVGWRCGSHLAWRPCSAGSALQRHTQMRPRGVARAFLQKQIAHHAIGAQRDMHMAQRDSGLGQQRQRQIGLSGLIGRAMAALHHRQHGAAAGSQGACQQNIVCRVV